uniref:hypothetical protein n=1 Tax=Paenibacillus sp. TaxID=58172 RepID=UPI00191F57DB|nr:hypothetical protein [Paenibacillus sp.]
MAIIDTIIPITGIIPIKYKNIETTPIPNAQSDSLLDFFTDFSTLFVGSKIVPPSVMILVRILPAP